jgi:hypothetical protein
LLGERSRAVARREALINLADGGGFRVVDHSLDLPFGNAAIVVTVDLPPPSPCGMVDIDTVLSLLPVVKPVFHWALARTRRGERRTRTRRRAAPVTVAFESRDFISLPNGILVPNRRRAERRAA